MMKGNLIKTEDYWVVEGYHYNSFGISSTRLLLHPEDAKQYDETNYSNRNPIEVEYILDKGYARIVTTEMSNIIKELYEAADEFSQSTSDPRRDLYYGFIRGAKWMYNKQTKKQDR